MKKKNQLYAWSKYLNCNIVCVLKITNNHWYFRMCDALGNPFGKVMKAGTSYNYFKWGKLYSEV